MSSSDVKILYFNIDISHEQYLRYYQGAVDKIIVTTEDGYRVQFPASFMQRYVTHSGIRGRFEIKFDESNKLVSLDKLTED